MTGLRLLRQNLLSQLVPEKHLAVLTDGNAFLTAEETAYNRWLVSELGRLQGGEPTVYVKQPLTKPVKAQ